MMPIAVDVDGGKMLGILQAYLRKCIVDHTCMHARTASINKIQLHVH